jgi:hypothetical protein
LGEGNNIDVDEELSLVTQQLKVIALKVEGRNCAMITKIIKL